MELFYSSKIEDNSLLLDQDESGHCVRVLRKRCGDTVSVIDGNGTLFRCTLVDDNPKSARAVINEAVNDFGTHPYNLQMAVCPTKNTDRYEWFVEKATEIGVDAIVPVIGDHSERKIFRTDRLKRIVLSAVKQSLKAKLPEVRESLTVTEYLQSAPSSSLRLICYCDSTLPKEKRTAIAEALGKSKTNDICILIGPEGDFSTEEINLALTLGWQAVHLGDSRLRTETAALAAVLAVYYFYPDGTAID